MLALYPSIKFVHVFCVVLSGSVFCVRGLLMLAGSTRANHRLIRRGAAINDTVLLAAALLLAGLSHQFASMQGWLMVKLLLLPVYIVLGVFALRRGRTRTIRAASFAAAIAVFAFMVSVAIAHDPRGILALIAR